VLPAMSVFSRFFGSLVKKEIKRVFRIPKEHNVKPILPKDSL
jgi:hypothetical protein